MSATWQRRSILVQAEKIGIDLLAIQRKQSIEQSWKSSLQILLLSFKQTLAPIEILESWSAVGNVVEEIAVVVHDKQQTGRMMKADMIDL